MTAMTARALPPAVESSRAVQGAIRRFRTSQDRLRAAEANYAETSRAAVAELLAAGLSLAQIAEVLGITKSRAHQLAQRN